MLLLQGRISRKQNMTLCVIDRVTFERYCGKMYSHPLFFYGGLRHILSNVLYNAVKYWALVTFRLGLHGVK